MYYTIYKQFVEFPLVILSNKNPSNIDFWNDKWDESESAKFNQDSILLALSDSSSGYLIDDPMIVFTSNAIELGRTADFESKSKCFDSNIFNGTLNLGEEQVLQVNTDSEIFIGYDKISVKVWGKKDKDLRKDLYIEIDPK